MGRSKKKQKESNVVLFDVWYDDGTRSSNRKVMASELEGFDDDDEEQIRQIIEAQDQKIADLSGRPRAQIKSVKRSAT